MPASGRGVCAQPPQSLGSDCGSKPPPALTPRVFPQVEVKSQEAQDLQRQRDQYLSHLQQYVAAYQQLASEKDVLQKQALLQTQLVDQLQHEEVQGKVAVQMAHQELQETQVRASECWAPDGESLQPVSLLTFFPGPLGAPGSSQPAEPAATSPAERHGCAWGR